jgi:membrane-bound serine protease (ClpP class)
VRGVLHSDASSVIAGMRDLPFRWMDDVAAVGARRRLRGLWRSALALAVPLVLVGGSPAPGGAQAEDGPVYIVDVSGTIDLGLAPYLERVLGDAEEAGAPAVLVEIDTPGGRLDAVLQMRDALLDSPVRTVALVESTAFSAGALVAIACVEIHMRPGAVMGAATPVVGGTGEVADEKTISAVRSTFEATAEERGRDPQVAEAMVDPEVEVEGLVERGQLLTLTTSEAVDVGYAEGVVADRAALLAELGLDAREQVETSPSLAEQLVRLITGPVVASLLLTVGMLALIADLLSGGLGLGVVVGIGLLTLFFWGHMLAGLTGWEDVALVVLGLVLIAVEVFILPGFGVPGILGLVTLLGGAFLAMVYRDFDFVTNDDLVRAAVTVGVTFVAIVVGLFAALALLSRRRPREGLILHARLGVGEPALERAPSGWLRWFDATARLPSDRTTVEQGGEDAAAGAASGTPSGPTDGQERSLLGAIGTALSDLRPSGVADIDGERVDVVTVGDYVRRGERIEVVRDDRYRRVVRRREP